MFNAALLALRRKGLSLLAARSCPSCAASTLKFIFAKKRGVHIDPKGTESEGSGTKNSTVYRNKTGEEIVLDPNIPPPGYVFVPSGNRFITRNCRKLAQKLYAVYFPKGQEDYPEHIGVFVPKDVFEQVRSAFEARRARIDEDLWRALETSYPEMPPFDKSELHDLVFSRYPSLTGKSAVNHMEIEVRDYVRDRYTSFNSLDFRSEKRDNKAISLVHETVEKVLASWRGKN